MRYRRIAGIVLLISLAAGCGGGDDTADDTTTTTIESAPTTQEPTSTGQILAKLVVQIDDHLGGLNQEASVCINGPFTECVGESLAAYGHLDDDVKAVGFILKSATDPSNDLYSGRVADDVVGLFDESINAGAEALTKTEAAQAVCIPSFPSGCLAANDKMETALIDLQKLFNQWRTYL